MNVTRSLWTRFKLHTDPFFGKPLDGGPDRFWKRRKTLMMSSHYFGRRRNCFRIAIRGVTKALQYVTQSRKLRYRNFKTLCDTRIEGAAEELQYNAFYMRESLQRLNIRLDRKVLANLAIYEPRTFRSVVGLSAFKTAQRPEDGGLGLKLSGPGMPIADRGKL